MTVTTNYLVTGNGITGSTAEAVQDLVSAYGSTNIQTQLLLKKWRVALAKVMNGSANAKLAFTGDSTTMGLFAGGSGTQFAGNAPFSVPRRIAAALTGRGVNSQSGSFFCNSGIGTVANVALYDTRLVFGAGWNTGFVTQSAGGDALTHNAANQNSLDFTPTQPFDTAEVWCVTNSAYQDFTIAVDGGAALATVDCSVPISILKTTVTTTLGTHTLNIAKSAANAAQTNILAVNTYDSATKAVQVWGMGYSGSTSGIWGTATTSVWLAPQMVATYAPDLSVICLGINDWIAAVSAADYKANMAVLIGKAKISGDVILVVPPPSLIGYGGITQANMDALRAAVFELSATYSAPVLDMYSRFENQPAADALGFYSDGVHPNKTGYQDWANALIGFIAP